MQNQGDVASLLKETNVLLVDNF